MTSGAILNKDESRGRTKYIKKRTYFLKNSLKRTQNWSIVTCSIFPNQEKKISTVTLPRRYVICARWYWYHSVDCWLSDLFFRDDWIWNGATQIIPVSIDGDNNRTNSLERSLICFIWIFVSRSRRCIHKWLTSTKLKHQLLNIDIWYQIIFV